MFLTILQGLPYTLLLTVSAFLIGVVGGVPLALARRSRSALVRGLAIFVIELLRGIPPIVWLFIIYFGLGTALPMLDSVTAAIIGLGVVSSAYLAETYRGGLIAISQGQWEATEALGLSRTDALTRVIGPQVARTAIPAATTYAIGLLKDSSVAYTIGVTEIVYFANSQARATSDPLVPFLVAAAVYIALTVPAAGASRALDSRLRRRVAR